MAGAGEEATEEKRGRRSVAEGRKSLIIDPALIVYFWIFVIVVDHLAFNQTRIYLNTLFKVFKVSRP